MPRRPIRRALPSAGPTTGTTYSYTVTSNGGSGSVSGSGSVTSAAQDITGINVSTLPDGVLTYSVKLINSIGNPGAAATALATLIKTAPNGYTITAVPVALSATTAADAGFKISGAPRAIPTTTPSAAAASRR